MSRARIRVVFLLFYFEAWDSLAEVYEIMRKDERFEPIVVTIPRKLTGYEDFADEDKVSAYLDARQIAHLRFDLTDSMDGLSRLRELSPDYLFLNYPWQRNYQPGYQIENLVEFTKVCYVPYFSLPLVNEPGVDGVAPHLFTQPTHKLAHLIFLQDATVKAALDASEHVGEAHLTGTPKIDALRQKAITEAAEWPIARSTPERNFRLVWAPHHSYGERWLNFGVFTEIRQQMLDYAAAHPELDLVLRPHPFLWGTLTDRDLMTAAELADWRASWDALPNTATHEVGSYASLFLATDALFTDGISFLAEYPLVTGKPTIFFEKAGHWSFTPIGEIAAASSVRVADFGSFEAAVDAAKAGLMPDRWSEIATLQAAASPYPGEAAARIVDIVREDAGLANFSS